MDNTPAFYPSTTLIANANISHCMTHFGFEDVKAFHAFSVSHYADFWRYIIDTLRITFKTKPRQICDVSHGIEAPRWFPEATLNIVDSCFTAPGERTAIIYQDQKITYAELNALSNRIANSLVAANFKPQDAIAIIMPTSPMAVAIYLGIIKMGGVVVSIADSFSSDEIGSRLRLVNTKAVFTEYEITWNHKTIPLYEKVCAANSPPIILLGNCHHPLREKDLAWSHFLSNNRHFDSVACDPMSSCNILFSSGTTATPKAIPWNHTTPIKAASDALLHHNIKPDDVLAWPSNLGWMMGPWLVFATLINQATMAIYPEAPKDRAFGEFIQNTRVTMLGVVPTIVAAWHQTRCMEGLDWSAIKLFSSTGECSNPNDMAYLMSLAGNKPIIEYCGGTEIGGAYVTSTVIQTNYPSQFSTPAMGSDFMIIDENGNEAEHGEVALLPPAIGLSTELLNADHHAVYYAGMPKPNGRLLRRHGDEMARLANGYYTMLGRVDDNLNLGGIKVNAAEIERVISGIEAIEEVAAVASEKQQQGPSQLVIYAATKAAKDPESIRHEMQQRINQHLNPLFKIHQVVLLDELPKTASNKIMRRLLRSLATTY